MAVRFAERRFRFEIFRIDQPLDHQLCVGRHPQVLRLMCGHVHCPTQRSWAGTQATTMPSVAVDVRKGIDETQAREQPIYLLHALSDEAGLVSQARIVGDDQ